MSKYSALIKRASNATAATALALASLTPAVMLGGSAKAAQIQSRSIEMASSAAGASTTWTVTLSNNSGATISHLKVCDSPLFDVTCADPDGNLTYADYNGTEGSPIDVTNPSIVGTFYARITLNTGDTGAVAMSTTQDVSINARVQEQLTFCVGSDAVGDITDPANTSISSRHDCSGFWSQTVDLGVVNGVQTSPVGTASPNLGNDKTGFFVLSTNAYHGARVAYHAASELKVAGATCGTPSNADDMCFDNASSVATNLTSGTENFGMLVHTPTHEGTSNGATLSLSVAGAYDGAYTWNTNSGLHTIASATKAVDWDKAVVDFSAATALSTPSGSYSTSANYVATGLF